MKFLYFIIFVFIFISCTPNKEVKIPVNDNSGTHKIWDNSRIYVLAKIKNGDTVPDLKLGQIITVSHWLVAIDKRLNLKKLIKPIEKILKKRHKKSIHYDPTKKAYFAYLDSIQKKVSFIDFDSIKIMPEIYNSETYFKKYFNTDKNINKFHLFVNKKNIVLNDSIIFKEPISKQNLKDSLIKYIAKNTKINKNSLYLNFNEKINFDRFLNYYTFFKNNSFPKGKMNNKIFICKH